MTATNERIIPDSTQKQIAIKTMHSFRHTFVTMAATNGIELRTIQDMVGHSSGLMTLHYAHSNRDRRREAVAKLGRVYTGNTEDEASVKLSKIMAILSPEQIELLKAL